MARLLFVTIIAFAFLSCDKLSLSEAQRNAKQYTVEKINESLAISINDVSSIEVSEVPDTIISDLPITYKQLELSQAYLKYVKGEISVNSLLSILEDAAQVTSDVRKVAQSEINNAFREYYSSYLLESYHVSIKMKSGQVRDVSVIMDRDGITPLKFRHQIIDSTEELDRQIAKICNTLY